MSIEKPCFIVILHPPVDEESGPSTVVRSFAEFTFSIAECAQDALVERFFNSICKRGGYFLGAGGLETSISTGSLEPIFPQMSEAETRTRILPSASISGLSVNKNGTE